MRARSRLPLAILSLLSVLVIGTGLAWACTPAEGGVDETRGEPGSQTTFTGRYFAQNEPVEVRWNKAYENSDTAPLLTTAQAEANGVLRFTVTIPQDEPGTYWIVVRGPGDGTRTGSMRAQAEYTIAGAAAPEEPEEAPPAEEEPEASTDPRPSGGNSSRGDGRNEDASADRSGETSTFAGGPVRQNDLAAAASSIPPSDDPVAGRSRPSDPPRLPAGALRHDPVMASSSPWTGVSADGDTNRAPTLMPVNGQPGSPLADFSVGATIFGVGLVLMFAGFFVADIRRQREAEAEVESNQNDLLS